MRCAYCALRALCAESAPIGCQPAGGRTPWQQLLCRPLPFETSTEHSAQSEGMICPIALWSGRGCHLLDAPAQPKHEARPCPLRCCVLIELLFQASLEPLGIGFLVLGCGRVQEYGGKSSQFPANSLSRPRILADRH